MAKKIRVKEWIRRGELGEHMTQAAIIENCGDLLDDAEASEIIGEVLFKATNGKYYTVTVEAVLGEASKSFVQDILDEEEAEQNIVNEAHDALDEALADGSSPDEK